MRRDRGLAHPVRGGPLKGVKINRLIINHSHPDHVGIAGGIPERFTCPLYMSPGWNIVQSVLSPETAAQRKRRNAQAAWSSFFIRTGMGREPDRTGIGRGPWTI